MSGFQTLLVAMLILPMTTTRPQAESPLRATVQVTCPEPGGSLAARDATGLCRQVVQVLSLHAPRAAFRQVAPDETPGTPDMAVRLHVSGGRGHLSWRTRSADTRTGSPRSFDRLDRTSDRLEFAEGIVLAAPGLTRALSTLSDRPIP